MTHRANNKELQKLDVFRVLYFLVYNDDRELAPLSVELFHVLGEILEGTPPSDLSLNQISKETLLRELSSARD
jgi:hypothetical protein